jgi:hypothetical protein
MTKKREKFIELAEKRVTKTIKDFRLIGNLSNRNNYEYTDQDIQQIVAALDGEVRLLKSKFISEDPRRSTAFKIKP